MFFLIVLCVLLCFIYTVCMTNFVSKICENNSPHTSQSHILDAVVDKLKGKRPSFDPLQLALFHKVAVSD